MEIQYRVWGFILGFKVLGCRVEGFGFCVAGYSVFDVEFLICLFGVSRVP